MSFSPALIEQVGFYTKRLRKEEVTRRLGLIFVALALAVQALVVFQPPESANATNQNDTTNKIATTTSNIVQSETSINISQDFVDATTLVAKAADRISYTVSISNTGESTSYDTKFEDNLSDVLEYAALIDNGGGALDLNTNILSWSNVTLPPGGQQTRTFIIKMLNPIPSTAKGKINSTSFDCIINNTFGNSINIKVDCPAPKIIEQTASQLPVIGPIENIVFISILVALTTYFYARTRQMRKELNIIKKDAISGMIQGI